MGWEVCRFLLALLSRITTSPYYYGASRGGVAGVLTAARILHDQTVHLGETFLVSSLQQYNSSGSK